MNEPDGFRVASLPEELRSLDGLQRWITSLVATRLSMSPSGLQPDQVVAMLGIDSLINLELIDEIESRLGLDLSRTSFLTEVSIAELSAELWGRLTSPPQPAAPALGDSFRTALGEHPVSAGQAAMWFIHRLDPGSAAYNIAGAAHMHGDLDVGAFESAFQNLVERHAALRTTFSSRAGEPVQVVHKEGRLEFGLHDASDWSESRLDEQLNRQAQIPFSLEHGPLLRVSLYRRSRHEHVILMVVHHAVADNWSLAVMMSELGSLYVAERDRVETSLPEMDRSYADFAYWQRELLASEEAKSDLRYWIDHLEGNVSALELPSDHERPFLQTYRGSFEVGHLDAELTQALKDLRRERGTTLHVTLLAAFEVLLHRYTQQDDFLVGFPTSGRTRPELTQLVGYFANPLVHRARLDGSLTFAEFVDQARTDVLDALDHQMLPFATLVKELRPERDPSRSPLFQVMFSVLEPPPTLDQGVASFVLGEAGATWHIGNIEFESISLKHRASQFDLSLTMTQIQDGMHASLEYNSDLFEAATASRMLAGFTTLLRGIVSDPDARISDLPVMGEPERRLQLVDWTNTSVDFPQGICAHELFEQQVRRAPDEVAVEYESERLTYDELNRRSNQLAHYLREVGVEPDNLVGVCVNRSPEMLVAVLGVWKAGAAYVPLDPDYPTDRLQFMLEDSGAEVVVTEAALLSVLRKRAGRAICLDADSAAIASKAETNPSSTATPTNLAYAIYTSGSTGSPKAAAIEHRSVVSLVDWATRTFGADELTGVLASTSLCFDLSVFELLVPLAVGGTVELVRDALALRDAPVRDHVTLINTVPSVMAKLLELEAVPGSVKTINLAGEAIPVGLVEKTYAQTSAGKVFNLYGPSEGTVYSTCALLDETLDDRAPIGRPISNVRTYVVDPNLKLVPIGMPGELLVGGACLARGYLHRPELTDEKFIPSPFAIDGPERLYRTGDLVRYRADGQLDFLGRIDRQVKVRGFRIELQEIETALRAHVMVRDAAVLVTDQDDADPDLAAYVVFHGPETIEARRNGELPKDSELRAFLRDRLPQYMIPAAFMSLEAIPLLPNGKVDLGSFPPIDSACRRPTGDFVAPKTGIETTLAAVWAKILGVERVGVDDDFFELGGHSLQAAEVVAVASEQLGVTVSIKELLLYSTVKDLARAVEGRQAEPMPHASNKRMPLSAASSNGLDLSSSLEFESAPLLSLIATGQIPGLDAAALAYLPSSLIERFGFSPEQVVADWCGGLPTLFSILDTALGRVGVIALPIFDTELYRDPELAQLVLSGLTLAGSTGADVVSLTGLIPSATDRGQSIVQAIGGRDDLPAPTTGHAATTAAVVMSIRELVEQAGRDLSTERVAFVGLGSIGLASLRLALRCLPHPAEIVLCDVCDHDSLVAIENEIRVELGFEGPVRLAQSKDMAPADVYRASLMVGATNVPDIVDIWQLQPGTLLVDDSAPHCFSAAAAFERLDKQGDILFSEGGKLRFAKPIRELRYLPQEVVRAAQDADPQKLTTLMAEHSASEITACIVSALLCSDAQDESMHPTIGTVDLDTCLQHFRKLDELGFSAAEPRCEGCRLKDEKIEAFRARFGSSPIAG